MKFNSFPNVLVFLVALVMGSLVFVVYVSAGGLVVGGVPGSVNVTIGFGEVVVLNVSNVGLEDLFDVVFSGVGVSSVPVFVPVNGSVLVDVLLDVGVAGVFSVPVSVVGFRSVGCSDLGVEEFLVNMTGLGVFPDELDLCVGSSVRFVNDYSSWVQLKVYPDVEFGSPIDPGSSFVRTFGGVGVFGFEVDPLIGVGVVRVVDSGVLVHNVGDDAGFVLGGVAVFEWTNVSLGSVSSESFVVGWDDVVDGFFVVRNEGDVLARDVVFDGGGGWLSFDKSGFSLGPGESRAVNFVLSPLVSDVGGTNRSYNVSLVGSGLNFDSVEVVLDVFVPFSEGAGSNVTSGAFWVAKLEFCERFPTSAFCITEPIVREVRVAEYDCPPILMNMSRLDVQDLMRSVKNGDFETLRNYNLMSAFVGRYENDSVAQFSVVNDSYVLSLETAEKVDDLVGTVIGILFGSLLIVGVSGVGVCFFFWYRKRVAIGRSL